MRANRLKARLAAGAPGFGVTLTLGSVALAEVLGLAGCDFVLLDAEHGLGDARFVRDSLRVLAGTPAHGIVRLASFDRVAIKRLLDMGAQALMIPSVGSAEEAQAIVAACRYPPRGTRGFAASGVRASDYGLSIERYLATHEQELLIAVMIETSDGVAAIDAIAAVEGVDVIQIGANDLSYDLGLDGRLGDPALDAAIAGIEAAARRQGKILAGALLPGDTIPAMHARGYRLFTLGRDAGLLIKAVRDVIGNATAALEHTQA